MTTTNQQSPNPTTCDLCREWQYCFPVKKAREHKGGTFSYPKLLLCICCRFDVHVVAAHVTLAWEMV